MLNRFDDLIEELLEASRLSPLEKAEIRREMESHFYEEVKDLQLKGWSDAKIEKHIRARFGSPEAIGKSLWTVYANKNPLFIFYSLLLTMFTWIKNNPARALSIPLLIGLVSGNFLFVDTARSIVNEYRCFTFEPAYGGFSEVGALNPENFVFDEVRNIFVFNEENRTDENSPYAEDCVYDPSIKKLDISDPSLVDEDLDGDKTLTAKEVYLSQTVMFVSGYLDTLSSSLYPLFIILLSLVDLVGGAVFFLCWFPARTRK